jgi:hypothetical protein
MKKLSVISLSILAALATLPAAHGADEVLFSENFSGGLEEWRPLKSSAPWEVSDGSVVSSGEVIFDVLETRNFAPITDGAFDVKVEVRFESPVKSPNNRFFLRMRDSEAGNQGYEVVVAQGTSGNTLLTEIKAEKPLSQKLESEAFVFPTDDFVPVRWVRDKQGKQQFFVDGELYLQAEGGSVHSFNKLILGTRAYAEAEGETSGMRHFFRNVELKKGPESL